MRICILGGDGYLGWPTSMHFAARGHDVLTIDNMGKRLWEARAGVAPLMPIKPFPDRVADWNASHQGKPIRHAVIDIATDYAGLRDVLTDFQPDAIVHYAEQPSAPYSMAGRAEAVDTQQNNVIGTLNLMFVIRDHCPGVHLIKLGTMGEYGTPNIDIEEGWLDVTHNGRQDRVLFPKRPGSLYHLTKVHDSANLEFACRVWGFRVTDLNQGVVYGIETDEIAADPANRATSFHYDSVFGTVLNRFVVQAAIGQPLTVYGKGGQTRGYLNIRDTLRCVELAAMNPADEGEFRVFNQFTEQFSVQQLADRVAAVGRSMGLHVTTQHIPNPRAEMEEHYYNAKHSALPALGLKPNLLTDAMLRDMIAKVTDNRDLVLDSHIMPSIRWDQRPARPKIVRGAA